MVPEIVPITSTKSISDMAWDVNKLGTGIVAS